MQLPSYPKVFAIGHAAIQSLFTGPVTVQEKVDGSQFSFGNIGGKLLCRSKNQAVGDGGNVEGMFKEAVATAARIFDLGLLAEGLIVRAEFLQKPKQNTIVYSRIPDGHLIVFDMGYAGEHYLDYNTVVDKAIAMGLETVPLVGGGEIKNPKVLLEILEQESILGGSKVEGIVVKNYSRFCEKDGKVMMGKFVREDFKERNTKAWKGKNKPGKDVVQNIIAQLRTEARWEKSFQHLKEEEKILGEPRDIGPLVGAVNKDVLAEESEWIKETLFDGYKKTVAYGVTKGLAEWYKKKLMESAFSVEK